jgi:branched-chain amino acid transport system substrate-binding protein
MKLLKTLKAALAAVLLGSLPSVGWVAEVGLTDTEITLGLFAPMSGPLAAFGLDPIQTSKMIYEEANKRGGVHGRKFKVLLEDDKCDTAEMQAVARKYVSVEKVFLLHGGSCTAGAQALQEYVTREKVPFIVLNAGADSAVFPPTRYVFAGNVGTQLSSGGAIMQFAINGLKGKRIAVVVHDDDIGTANWRTAKATAEKAKVEIAAYERVPPKATDLTASVLNVRKSNPDAIVLIAYPAPAVLFMQKYAEFGMKQPVVASVQAVPNAATFAANVANNAALTNFYYTTPLADEAKLAKWNDLYKAYYPSRTAGPWVAFGVPTASAVVAAFEKAGRDVTRESFINALETLTIDSGALAGPSVFGKDRRDGFRSAAFIKFDGTASTRMPGVYTWDGSIAAP